MKEKDWLLEMIKMDTANLVEHHDKFIKGQIDIHAYLSATGKRLLVLGLYEFLIYNEIVNFQNRLNVSAKFQIIVKRIVGSISLDSIFTSLLSEDSNVIKEACDPKLLPYKVNYDPMDSRPVEEYPIHPGMDSLHQTFKGIQCIMSGDQQGLHAAIEQNEMYRTTKKKKWSTVDELFHSYQKSILEKDQDTLQKTIDQMYKKKKSIGGFVSRPVSSNMHGFIKLAIHAGMEVTLDKPDIHWDIINATPLEKYDSYDWLDVLFYEGLDAYYEKFGKLHNQKPA